MGKNQRQITSGLVSSEVSVCRQFSGNLEAHRPSHLNELTPERQAARRCEQ